MKRYQCFIVFNSTIQEEQGEILIDSLKKYIEKNGKIVKTEFLGLRKLLNERGKIKQGYYYSIIFKAEEEIAREIERKCRLADEVLKYVIIDED